MWGELLEYLHSALVFLSGILKQALTITAFVSVMMLVVEYLNVFSRGTLAKAVCKGRWQSYLASSFFGATPGCLGAFAVVALYSHRLISRGALVGTMVATSGDESFVMLALFPKQALILTAVLFVLGMIAAVFSDRLLLRSRASDAKACRGLELHQQDSCVCFPRGQIVRQWQQCSLARGVLTGGIVLFIFALVSGGMGPAAWNWVRVTLLVVALFALLMVTTVPEHFLEEHLWNHVAKKHVFRIFLWTFGAILVMNLLTEHLHLEECIGQNPLVMLLIACLVGLIPESGPHLIFVTLFAKGAIPFSVLLASSAVQDGHGMLPLLAYSRTDFLKVKGINFAIGLAAGMLGYATGW